MKTVLFLLIICVLPIFAFSQDLIVTEKGDSLNCRVTKEKTDYIYFTFRKDNEIRNTLLATSDIKTLIRDYWQEPEVLETEILPRNDYKIIRLALSTGYSHRTAPLADNIPRSMESFYKKLKSGFHIDAKINAYTSEYLGFGARYNFYKSKSENKDIGEEVVTINYFGPSFCTRLFSRDKSSALLSSISLGYMGYTDKINNNSQRINGNTLGIILDLGYDFAVSENTALGFQIALIGGTLSKITVTDGTHVEKITLEDEQREGLGRIDFSIGLRF